MTHGFMPHGYCFLWTPWLLWMNVISDAVIALAYYSIPIALLVFVRRRQDLQFSWVFVLFSVFIFACGTTHLMSIWTIWNPDYSADAIIKVITSAASILTAVLLWPLVPKAVALPSPLQLQAALGALAAANETLERRVADRTTALRQAEQRLQRLLSIEHHARLEAERMGRMKDEFLLTLSHELRTPLSAIFGWAQILKRRSDQKVVEQAVDVIDRNVRIQTKLIEDLLDMSAIVAGKIRLDIVPVNIATMIELATTSIKPAADAKNIRIEQQIDPTAGSIRGDAARLQQVVWNLLNNAAKFTPRGGRISIAVQALESLVQISVTDSGDGIAAEFLPFIFDRFSQADSSSRRSHGGIGVGLSIVKSLVEAHGGTVEAHSDGLGKGAVFTVLLPFSPATSNEAQHLQVRPATAVIAGMSKEEWPVLNGIRVLVVDDEKDARELIQLILEERAASVRTAGSAAQAREQLSQSKPDVIVCDIGMPGEDGYDFIGSLQAQGIAIPAIALTAFARQEDRARSLQAGFRCHLSKPVEPFELLNTIASLAAAGLGRV